ncbi:Hypothetical predicted protein, partial [Xyrichtys novacula]
QITVILPKSLPVCEAAIDCQSPDVLEVQACGGLRRLAFGLGVVDGREREGKGHGDPRRERANKKRLEDEKHHLTETGETE